MSAIQSIGFSRKRPTDGISAVNETSDIPTMRPRTGTRGTDQEMVKLLDAALESLANSSCCFWACNGPSRPQNMCTCSKCWAMRDVATVYASLKARLAAQQGAMR